MTQFQNKHVGFTGTQQGWSPKQLPELRLFFLYLRSEGGVEWLHEGDCIGSDAQANETWREMLGSVWQHPPEDQSKRAFKPYQTTEDPLPYLDRNQAIVDSSELLIATPGQMGEELRSGTWATIRYARKKGIPRFIFLPDGSLKKEF